ncbi:hypothetical protein ABH924_003287 [Arthrobacter sp. GAS37]
MQWTIQGRTAVGVCPACFSTYGPTDEAGIDSLDAHHAKNCVGQPPAGMPAAVKRKAQRLLSGNY